MKTQRTALPLALFFLGLAVLGASAATAQTELFFATGVDSTGRALAQSNADGHVLIESPQYPRGLWLHLVDEAGDALAGIRVEYQGRPDSLVAIHCVDPAGGVQETLVWTRPDGTPLSLMLKPSAATDLPAEVTPIDWQIDPTAEALLELKEETRLEGWEAVAAFLWKRWHDRTGRVAVQFEAKILAVELDHPEAIESLVTYLQQLQTSASDRLGESTALIVQTVQLSARHLGLWESVIFYVPLFADANLEKMVREALGRPQGRLILKDVASLSRIWAINKSIVSLVGLENCTALQSLSLIRNQIVDLTPLANLNNLQSLRLSSNQIVDLTPLANLTHLKVLTLETNQKLSDIRPLANLNNLEELHLNNNYRIADWGPLANLNNLQSLGLNNTLADVEPLANLNNLQSLWLGSNHISDVTPLASLNNLRTLRTLSLYSNQIWDVKPLAKLTNLEILDLRYNQITEVGPLANLTNLERLNLRSNRMSDVEPLANLNNLYFLDVTDNQITDVKPLLGLTRLSHLNLKDNQIEDLAPLVANTGLSEGDEVHLTGNPLSDQALNEQIPALEARGVSVTY